MMNQSSFFPSVYKLARMSGTKAAVTKTAAPERTKLIRNRNILVRYIG